MNNEVRYLMSYLQVYSVNKTGSRESRSPWGQITDTFKEKLDTVVKGRRHSKEHSDRYSIPLQSRVDSCNWIRCTYLNAYCRAE